MYIEPDWYKDCIELNNDCSICPWSARESNGLKICEQDIQEHEAIKNRDE